MSKKKKVQPEEEKEVLNGQSQCKEEVEAQEQELEKEDITETEALKKQTEELNDKNLRLMAEFDNYRKRSLKERIDLIKTANEKLLEDMLPLIDDFDRAMQAMDATDDINAVKEGLSLIYAKFISFLNQNGIKNIDTEDAVFDTEYHEAVTTFPVQDEDMKGKIIDCISKGYTLNDKVIRFSKVVVGE
ncbi:MAG: nucleotide exchange factor GrpE [Prevotellaceae bacterium]|jgi:molecular chaperone GrpE|nr:nucleotide exchange factor GrpE [Prevotellaceae bacterium]